MKPNRLTFNTIFLQNIKVTYHLLKDKMHRVRLRPLRWLPVVVLSVWSVSGYAIGLGTISVQSGLGQPLVASIPLLGDGRDDLAASCVHARIETIDGGAISIAQVGISRVAQSTLIRLTSTQKVDEPAVSIAIDIACSQSVRRSYQILLDPVSVAQAAPQSRQPARDVGPAVDAIASRVARAGIDDPDRQPARTQPAARGPATLNREPTPLAAPPAARPVLEKKIAPKPAAPRRPAAKAESAPRATLRLTSSDALSLDSVTKAGETSTSPVNPAVPAVTVPVTAAQPEIQSSAEKAAEFRMAEMARENDLKMRALLAEVQALRAATERIRQQSLVEKAAMDAARKELIPVTWVAALGGLLLLSLCVIGWLLWRRRSEQYNYRSSWDDILNEAGTEGVAASVDGNSAVRPSKLEALEKELDIAPFVVPPEVFEPAPVPVSAVKAVQPVVEDLGVEHIEEKKELPPLSFYGGSVEPMLMPVNVEEVQSTPQAEEASAALQLAEVWMSEHNPFRAIEILEPYSDEDKPILPAPSLYLLELYRVTSEHAKYAMLLNRLEQQFDIQFPAVDGAQDRSDVEDDFPALLQVEESAQGRGLAAFPDIEQVISDLQDSDLIVPYLENLLLTYRDGFDLSVYREITRAIALAKDRAEQHKWMNAAE
ncbi:MAG: hypothetical protein JWQ23_1632 [Herminiimonas sp.]|nr:hypothetical protein [Herminiimonas sp.]